MPLIDSFDFDTTPDEILPISAGDHTFEIRDISEGETEKGGGYVEVVLQCVDEGEDNGRRVYDRFYLKHEIARVNFKKFVMAAGHSGTGAGLDTAELIGCSVRANVSHRSYQDNETGETKEVANIKKYYPA